MISKRSYKSAYPDHEARAELRRCAGTQFDPQIVEAFVSLLDEPDNGKNPEKSFPGFARLLHSPETRA